MQNFQENGFPLTTPLDTVRKLNVHEEDSKMKTRKNLIYVKFYLKRYVIA